MTPGVSWGNQTDPFQMRWIGGIWEDDVEVIGRNI